MSIEQAREQWYGKRGQGQSQVDKTQQPEEAHLVLLFKNTDMSASRIETPRNSSHLILEGGHGVGKGGKYVSDINQQYDERAEGNSMRYH
jgi:hypothetical protein